MNRRKFSKSAGLGLLSLYGIVYGCSPAPKKEEKTIKAAVEKAFSPFFKLSLAQWSLNESIREGGMDPFDFAKRAKKMGFEGLEYVSGLYDPFLEKQSSPLAGMKAMSSKLMQTAKAEGLENLLIMIDGEGDLGIQDKKKRLEGVKNHHKWVDMAKEIGCHSIRLNLFGEGEEEKQIDAAADSMMRIGDYAKDMGINILVENHGGLSSDPNWVVKVMKKANRSNVGTLPDFGNFCIEREGGERWGAPCVNEYPDVYEAVKMMMPYAKAVSAKSYAFDENGNETKIDYYKMMKVVKDAGYTGYVGVEYEGGGDEEKGILATKDLLINAAKKIQNVG